MKAADYFNKAEHLNGRQMRLDLTEDSDIIVDTFHTAAHHYLCASLEWLGHNPQAYGHKHSKHPTALREAKAPQPIQEAWRKIEELRSLSTYGGGGDETEATTARTHLATIQQWAVSCRP